MPDLPQALDRMALFIFAGLGAHSISVFHPNLPSRSDPFVPFPLTGAFNLLRALHAHLRLSDLGVGDLSSDCRSFGCQDTFH